MQLMVAYNYYHHDWHGHACKDKSGGKVIDHGVYYNYVRTPTKFATFEAPL